MKVKRSERSNSFCGPAALSLLSGKHVDDCVKEVHAYRNRDGFLSGFRRRSVKGMSNTEMLRVLLRMGYDNTGVCSLNGYNMKTLAGPEYIVVPKVITAPTLVAFMRWLKKQPQWNAKKTYLINITGHYIVMKGIKLFDNRHPEGIFFGKYGHRRARVKYAWEVARRTTHRAFSASSH